MLNLHDSKEYIYIIVHTCCTCVTINPDLKGCMLNLYRYSTCTCMTLTPRPPAPLGCSPDRYPVSDPWEEFTTFWVTGWKMLREAVFLWADQEKNEIN